MTSEELRLPTEQQAEIIRRNVADREYDSVNYPYEAAEDALAVYDAMKTERDAERTRADAATLQHEKLAIQAVRDEHEISALRADLEVAEERAAAAEALLEKERVFHRKVIQDYERSERDHLARREEAEDNLARAMNSAAERYSKLSEAEERADANAAHAARLAEVLGVAEHELTTLNGCFATDLPWVNSVEEQHQWQIDNDAILKVIRDALTAPDAAALLARYRAEQAVIAAIVAEQLADERLTELVHSGAEEEALNNQTRRLRGAARTAREAIANLRALTTPTPEEATNAE